MACDCYCRVCVLGEWWYQVVKRNYRGRYEGEDWRMQADRQKTERSSNMFNTIFSTAANKFWVGVVGFALQALTAWTGIDFELLGLTPEAIIGFVTAIGVFAIPNKP